jgi:hypothetical protein
MFATITVPVAKVLFRAKIRDKPVQQLPRALRYHWKNWKYGDSNSGFHTWQNFFNNYLQSANTLQRSFISSVLGRRSSTNVSLKRQEPAWGAQISGHPWPDYKTSVSPRRDLANVLLQKTTRPKKKKKKNTSSTIYLWLRKPRTQPSKFNRPTFNHCGTLTHKVIWLPPTETTTSAWHMMGQLRPLKIPNTSANTDAEAGMIPMPTHQMKITPYPEVTASCLMEAWIHLWNTLWPKTDLNNLLHILVQH